MKKGLYVIYDEVAKEAGAVFEAKNDDVAVRMFKNTMVNNPTMKADEYSIMRIGTFDSESMLLERSVFDSLDEQQIKFDFEEGKK